jgi:quercetin dioxygenase-like cupin family protein
MAQIVRVYSGDDGESHFENLTPDQMAEIVFPLGDGAVTFSQRPSPTFSDYHTAPRRQYVVNIAGIAEFEISDGTKVRMVPGDILVAEDLTGHGHIARSIGDEPRISLAIPMPG